MKILITGGAGFMGSNFIHHLIQKRDDVEIINLDKLTYAGNLENLRDIEDNPRYRFRKGSIDDSQLIDEVMNGIDIVINYAAETHVDRSIFDPESFIRTDVLGTFVLLEAAKKYKVKKFIQISTDEVFGSIEEGLFHEESPFMPNSPYSASKASGDHLCRAYFQTFGVPTIVTHSCNYYGPYQYPEKLIPLFITNLLEGKKVPLYGNGQNVREWIFTEDHCDAVLRVMDEGSPGEVYNIGSGQRHSNKAITDMLVDIMGKDESWIEYVEDRPGHDFRYAIDATKIQNDLGFHVKNSFETSLEKTVHWYETNQEWWKQLRK